MAIRILFYLGHPAHYYLFKNVIRHFQARGNVKILIKKKDVLEDLVRDSRMDYVNIYSKNRGASLYSTAMAMLRKDWEVFRVAKNFRPELMVGTSAEIAHVGKLIKVPSIVVNEDDFDVVPLFAKAAYPWATHILAPDCCRVGKWSEKTITYPGYHELAYLHPNQFTPDRSRVSEFHSTDEPFFIMRFAKLTAHHDTGRTGITRDVSHEIVKRLEKKGRVYITSERELEPEFERYRLKLKPLDIHHAMAFASLFVGDSQTMTAEASVLGTPAIRFNDFVGEISYLEELEHRYELTYGIRTDHPEKLLQKVEELSEPGVGDCWDKKRSRMLEEKIDVSEFMIRLFENYPGSVRELRENPDPQKRSRFRGGTEGGSSPVDSGK